MLPAKVPVGDYRRVTFWTLWTLGGLSLWECGKRAVDGYREHKLDYRAQSFAFNALYSVAPALIVVVSSIVIFTDEATEDRVLNQLEVTILEGLPGDASETIVKLMRAEGMALDDNKVFLTLFGWLFLVYTGRNMILTISGGLDYAYGVSRRRWVYRNAVASGVVVGTVFALLLLSVTLQLVADEVLARLDPDGALGWARVGLVNTLKWVLSVLFLLMASSIVYTHVPSARLRWTLLTPGGALFAVSWMVATQGFRFYITHYGNYGQTYGALAGIVVLMTWLYLTGTLLLFGGQLNSVIHRHALAVIYTEERKRSRGVADVPAVGAVSDPTPEEVEEKLEGAEAGEKETAPDADAAPAREPAREPAAVG